MQSAPVSVIVPCYNTGASVARALDSIFNQTFPPTEVIVVNDGSTDDSSQILQRYAPRIRYLEQLNQGPSAARNAGMGVASGRYIAFLDADDYWLPGFVRACFDPLECNPQLIAVSTALIIKTPGRTDRILPRAFAANPSTATQILDDFFTFWAAHDHIRTGSAMIRRDVIQRAGGQRPELRIGEDMEYWAYLSTFGAWGFIPQPLWVGNPMPAAARQGWRQKNQARRELCPTVEQWEQRITPRLSERDGPGFRRVRGRVAAAYTHARILAAHDADAWRTFRTYAAEMPRNRMTRLMRIADPLGPIGRMLGAKLIRFQDTFNALMIALKARVFPSWRAQACIMPATPIPQTP